MRSVSNREEKYLGNPMFTPFFAAIETIKAIVYVHPTACELWNVRRSEPEYLHFG
ncbi:hypothetical protein B0H10DRAFT_2049093, partial [Mycena sp. CBHHK59/15]